MDLRQQILRHRKDNRVIGGGMLLLLIVCSIFWYVLRCMRVGLPGRSPLCAF